jgi:hypothetical protein
MAKLFENIRDAVRNERFLVSWHADDSLEKRELTAWQIVAGLEDATLIQERPRSKPNPSIVVRQELADGGQVEVVWSWLAETKRAKLVTVYFRD